MFDCSLETRSLFLKLLKEIFLIVVMVIAFSTVCSAFQWKGIEITPSITSTTEYSDNVFYDDEDVVKDVINRISPGLAIRVPGTRSEFEFAYTAGFEFFAENPDWNDVTHEATGRIRIQPLQYIIFTLDDSFVRGSDPTLIDIFGLRRVREKFSSNSLRPSLEYTFGPDRVLSLNYTNEMIEYDRSTLLLDSREDTVNPVLTYRIGRSSLVTLDYTYTHGDFETAFDELDGNAVVLGYEYSLTPRTSILADGHFLLRNFTGPMVVDYKIYAFLLGLRRELTPHLTIEAQGGYLRYEPDEMDEEDNFTGIFTVIYESGRMRGSVSAERGYQEIFAAIENLGYASSWRVTGSFEYTLHRFWSIELTGSYNDRDFSYQPREDRYWTAGGTLSFEPVEWFEAEVRYEHEVLDVLRAVEPGYKVNRVMLTLQLRY